MIEHFNAEFLEKDLIEVPELVSPLNLRQSHGLHLVLDVGGDDHPALTLSEQPKHLALFLPTVNKLLDRLPQHSVNRARPKCFRKTRYFGMIKERPTRFR